MERSHAIELTFNRESLMKKLASLKTFYNENILP